MKRFIGICFLLSAFFFYGVLVGKYQLFPFYSIQISKHFLEEKFARFFSQSNSGIFNIQCQNNLLSEGSRFLNYQIRLVNKNAPFAARDGAGAVFHEDKLFLIGGWNALDKKNFPTIHFRIVHPVKFRKNRDNFFKYLDFFENLKLINKKIFFYAENNRYKDTLERFHKLDTSIFN